MVCNSSRWCGWLQSVAQLLVAACIVYAAYIVNGHMEASVKAFSESAKDLHEIRLSMTRMETEMNHMSDQMVNMNNELHHVNDRLYNVNRQMNGVRSRMNPFRMFSPF